GARRAPARARTGPARGARTLPPSARRAGAAGGVGRRSRARCSRRAWRRRRRPRVRESRPPSRAAPVAARRVQGDPQHPGDFFLDLEAEVRLLELAAQPGVLAPQLRDLAGLGRGRLGAAPPFGERREGALLALD